MTYAYEVQDLAFAYDGPPVLEIDHLRVPAGNIVALVGPNGSGKTTLLHALAFLETPQRGSVRLFGESQTSDNLLVLRRKVSLLLQIPYLFHDTVLGNVMWGLRMRGLPRKKSRERALASLEKVGLSGFEKRPARSLSGGESQRVALARSLALDPEVLLLDEPSNHLDRESASRIEEIVLDMNGKHGKTIILATHDAFTVKKLAHQVINLVQGKILGDSGETADQ
jgi:tungstate transport system ATP-binding protein